MTHDELWDMVQGLTLSVTIRKTKTFNVAASALALSAVRECLEYGFRQKSADHVVSAEKYPDDASRFAETELFLGRLCDGTWVTERARATGVDADTRDMRAAALVLVRAHDKPLAKQIAKLEGDERIAAIELFIEDNSEAVVEQMVNDRAEAERAAAFTAKLAAKLVKKA